MNYTGMHVVLPHGCLGGVLLALKWGGVTYPWSSGRIIGLFAAAGALFILLAVQQAFTVFTTVLRRTTPIQFFK